MEAIADTEMRTVKEALDDGTLLDVTEAAKAAGMRCQTFISASFWRGKSIHQSNAVLQEVLEALADIYAWAGYAHLGVGHAKVAVDYENAIQPRLTCILEPNDDYGGLVLIITDYEREAELNIKRTTGESMEYSM